MVIYSILYPGQDYPVLSISRPSVLDRRNLVLHPRSNIRNVLDSCDDDYRQLASEVIMMSEILTTLAIFGSLR